MNRIRYAALVLLISFVVPMISAQELRSAMLRHPRVDVQKHYDLLTTLNVPDQKAFYRTLPVDLRADLWTLHLEQFLNTHPTLTVEQRSVIFEALGLLAAGVLESTPSPDDGLDTLKQHAMALPHPLRLAAFVELGSRPVGSKAPGADRPRPRLIETNSVQCSCSMTSDWCFETPTSPYNSCESARCSITEDGCGTFWRYACNGCCSGFC